MDKLHKKQQSIEDKLWAISEKLRKNIDPANYKHIILGLIFLRYASFEFENIREKKSERTLFIPPQAHWNFLKENASDSDIGQIVNHAMEVIERENEELRGALPRVYKDKKIENTTLGKIIYEVGNINMENAINDKDDFLGYVFEYFLGRFALKEGRRGGQFYTPRSVVELLVSMLKPYKGRIMDPCCGSGGIFVQYDKFLKDQKLEYKNISFFGQETNLSTWQLAKMNLTIRGIDSSGIKWNNKGSFLKDAHKNVLVDYIISNPPFNLKDWGFELISNDPRWKYGIPPRSNANYAWIQHFLHHLNPTGKAGFIFPKGALTAHISGQKGIRNKILEEGFLDCIVMLPDKLFLNTNIPTSIWIMSRKIKDTKKSNLEMLFIDAGQMGTLTSRGVRILTSSDIKCISSTYQKWSKKEESYENIPGFCKSVPIKDVKASESNLNPGLYVGNTKNEDNIDFKERLNEIKATLENQFAEEEAINEIIKKRILSI